MKEIRFRFWDIEFKKMFKDHEMIKKSITFNEFFNNKYSPVEIMQYTGLQDVTGKEIYEGDIIKPSDSKLFFIIAWDDNLCKFGGLHPDKEFGLRLNKLDTDCYTIVGNIYENPELLELGRETLHSLAS